MNAISDPPGRITIHHVATAAGVSATTVSDSLTGKGRLSPETRNRVIDVAKKLGYQASSAAKNLVAGRTGIIMMSIALPGAETASALNVEFFVSVMSGAAEEASRQGYALAMAPPSATKGPYTFPYDGAIVVDPVRDNFLVQDSLHQGRPIVTVGRLLGTSLVNVDNDFHASVPQILDRFAEGGAKRPALMLLEGEASYLLDLREAYLRWCQKANVPAVITEVPTPPTEIAAERALRNVLETKATVDAVLAGLDRIAIGVQTCAESLGRAVPGQLQIASVGDSESLACAAPPITALELNPTKIGQLAATAVIGLIEGQSTGGNAVVPARIVDRATTCGPGRNHS